MLYRDNFLHSIYTETTTNKCTSVYRLFEDEYKYLTKY